MLLNDLAKGIIATIFICLFLVGRLPSPILHIVREKSAASYEEGEGEKSLLMDAAVALTHGGEEKMSPRHCPFCNIIKRIFI